MSKPIEGDRVELLSDLDFQSGRSVKAGDTALVVAIGAAGEGTVRLLVDGPLKFDALMSDVVVNNSIRELPVSGTVRLLESVRLGSGRTVQEGTVATIVTTRGRGGMVTIKTASAQFDVPAMWLQLVKATAQAGRTIQSSSGLAYKIIKAGKGGRKPTMDSQVRVHYRGTLTDGTEFDSSYKRGTPSTFGLKSVVAGMREAFQLMTVGDHWKLSIPAKLAYAERGVPGLIGPNQDLMFEVELLEIL